MLGHYDKSRRITIHAEQDFKVDLNIILYNSYKEDIIDFIV